jgi:hypothetical protein
MRFEIKSTRYELKVLSLYLVLFIGLSLLTSLQFGGRRKKPLSKLERGWGEVKKAQAKVL